MSLTFRRTLTVAAGVIVVGAFLLALLSQAGALRDYRWEVSPSFLAAAGLVALLRGPFLVYPWWQIVRSWGYSLGWWRAMRVYFHSGLARYIPGQYWFVLGRVYLAEARGVPKSVTAASTLVESVLGTGTAAGVALLGLATAPGWSQAVMALFIALALLIPVLLVFLIGSPLAARFWDWAMQRFKRPPLPSQLSWSGAIKALLGSYLDWTLYGLVAAFTLVGVSGGAYLPQSPAVAGIFVASVLGAGMLLFIPLGIVIREGILVYLLNTLLAVPLPEAIAAAALTRLIAMSAEGIWALAALRVK
jgi:hypothetical protein